MISTQAIEAAAKAMHLDAYPADYWETRPDLRYKFTERARAALEAAAQHMLAGQRVTTEEELYALPIGTVVLSEEVTHHEGGWFLSYQRWQDGDWHRGARSGSTHPDNFLPAVVLHRPSA